MVHLLLDLVESERDHNSFDHDQMGFSLLIDKIQLKDKNPVTNFLMVIMFYHGQSVRQNSIQY